MRGIFVEKKAAPADQTVTVYYWDYTQSKTEAVATKEFKVAADAAKLNVTADMAPEGYDIAADSLGEHTIINGTVAIFVEKRVVATPTKFAITVNMFDEANGVNGKPVKTYTVSADKDAKSITVDAAQIPTGYVKANDETYEKNVIGGKDDYVAFWIKKDAKAPEVADIHVYIKSSNNDWFT